MDIHQNEWQLAQGLIYLNHAAVTPWPKRTHDAVVAFAQQNYRYGSQQYPQWLKTEQQLRHNLSRLINAPSENDIALVKNTSEALSFVAYGLDWRPGDNIIISDEEFPSNRIVWESLKPLGVEVREVNLYSAATPEQSVIDACDKRTRLIAISSVQFASGLCLKLETLGQFCHEQDILFCVDAIQSIGALTLDVQAINADFVAADGHKWMLGPEGLALFYCKEKHRDSLKLNQFGWHMVENYGEFDKKQWQPANSARRFECGSPNMLGIHALDASISLLLEVGMHKIEKLVREKADLMFELVDQSRHLHAITKREAQRYAGIVAFKHNGTEQMPLYQHLMQRNVVCALRGGAIRFSPHYYTPNEQIREAVALAADYH